MIVRYMRERGYGGGGKDPLLTIGSEYAIISLAFRSDGHPNQISVICDDDGTPGVFDYSCFDVIDPQLPNEWCFVHLSDQYQRLTPKEFMGDFWDRYHDGDVEAEAVFSAVAKRIEAFHTS